jgi:hypothetical protein
MAVMNASAKPLPPGKAAEFIKAKLGPDLDIKLTKHAKDKMSERGLVMRDILYVMKFGNIFEEGEPSSQLGLFKYKMECSTPNSGGRTVRVVLIPSASNVVKIVTVMWVDENRVGG